VSWCWLDLVAGRADGADMRARVLEPDGGPAGWLAVWTSRAKPSRSARRIDARLVDPAGAAAWVSLVCAPAGVRLPFDDLVVQQARRAVLAGRPYDGVSTLLSDASHFEGAITVARGEGVARLGDDPFGRIFPARVLLVEAGVLGAVPPPCGPTIERYGSAEPWPWDRYAPPR
jgi:hypothetical protein